MESTDQIDSDKKLRVMVFTSPKAGSGQRRQEVPRLVESLQQRGIPVEVTHKINQLEAFAETADEAIPIVVAAGGDGTISLAASAVAPSRRWDTSPSKAEPSSSTNTRIVPMPLGTENLLARYFGQTSGAEDVLQTILHGDSFHLDTGTANDLPFLIMASCGFDAEVVRAMHFTRRGHISRLHYFNPMMRALRRYRFPYLSLRVDDQPQQPCCWAMVFNLPRYGGGLNVEPEAVGDDGLLDVIAFKQGSIYSGVRYATDVWLGRHLKSAEVLRLRGKTIEIDADERVPFQVDGDYGGRLPLRVEVQPRKIHLLVPPKWMAGEAG